MKRKFLAVLLCLCLCLNMVSVLGAEPEIEIIPHEKSQTWLIAPTVSDKLYTGKEFAKCVDGTWMISDDNFTFREAGIDPEIGNKTDTLRWMNGVYVLFDIVALAPNIEAHLYDGFYDQSDYTCPVYVLDQNFNLIKEIEYEGILVDYVIYNDEFHFVYIQQFEQRGAPHAHLGWKAYYCQTSDCFENLQVYEGHWDDLLPQLPAKHNNRFQMPVVYENPLRAAQEGSNVYYDCDINQYSLDGVYFKEYPKDLLLRKRIWYANGFLYVNREDCYEKMAVSWPEYTYVKVNDNILGFNQPPVMENDRTLVPMRFLFEQLGDKVVWDDQTQTVTAFNNTKVITIGIDDYTAYVNGEPVTLDVPPRLINDQTFVPLRFLSENLGYSVAWDAENNMAIIETEVQK